MFERDIPCLNIVDKSFKGLFYKLGYSIGESPRKFIVIPIFISLLLGTGLQQFDYRNNPEYLYAPANGQAQIDKRLVDHFFPTNYSDQFNPSRFTHLGRLARLFITTQDDGNLLRVEVWREIQALDELIKNVKFIFDDEVYHFHDLCAEWNGQCWHNDILDLGDKMDEIEAGNLTLSYPVMLNPANFQVYPLPLLFGGISVSNQSTMLGAKAVQINYFLNVDTFHKRQRGAVWEKAVLEALEKADNEWKFIKISRVVGRSLPDEIDKNTLTVIPYMIIAGPFMVLFAVATCMMRDCVRSKPWLGLAGVLTSGFGTLTAFGLLCYCGVPFVNIVVAAPFLMLGIGMDDAFVMLAAWRQTSVHDPVPKRMAEAYSESAVSITITSLTDMVSFLIGIMTPFPAVQIFSIYTATAVVTTYLFHLFVFGGTMAVFGYLEADNRHSIFFWLKATPRSQMNQLKPSKLYRLLFTGGTDPSDPHNPLDHSDHAIMVFFRDNWAPFLSRPQIKTAILLLFTAYIGASIWGISHLEEGLELKKIARDDSYVANYFDTLHEYFTQYPYRVQVVIKGELDYSDKSVQEKIEKMMQEFENSPYTKGGAIFTESWLRSFLRLAERYNAADYEFNITTEGDFIKNLKESGYLAPSSVYSLDVAFNEDETKIVGSRFIIQPVNVSGSTSEWKMVKSLRKIAQNHAEDLNVTVFHPYFAFTDQALIVRSTTIQCVSIAGIVMLTIAFIFIPNPLCALWVAFSVLSIEAGVLGFLTFWNVKLDAVTMLNLIMVIGFSVDFSAHISYAYMSAEDESSKGKLRSSLYSLGLPIVQGALSTIFGVAILSIAPSYALNNFFKSVFLVMVIAAAHGLLILPVLLSLFGPGSFKREHKLENMVQVVETYKKNDKDVF